MEYNDLSMLSSDCVVPVLTSALELAKSKILVPWRIISLPNDQLQLFRKCWKELKRSLVFLNPRWTRSVKEGDPWGIERAGLIHLSCYHARQQRERLGSLPE